MGATPTTENEQSRLEAEDKHDLSAETQAVFNDNSLMRIFRTASPDEAARMDSAQLRDSFTCRDLFTDGQVSICYWDTDRTLLGGAVPLEAPLELPNLKFVASDFFCQRRELGVINLGGAGTVEVDADTFSLQPKDCLYAGKGSRDILLGSDDPANPARFYLLSYPAHQQFPTKHVAAASIEPLNLGTQTTASRRRLFKMICPQNLESCQLVMGFTELEDGSIWNTFPPHIHERRSEIYLYFEMPDDAVVMHFMGKPEATRHVVMRNLEAVLSPGWSIHCGAGSKNYSFVWGMGGENQDFDDMDHVEIANLT